MAPNITGKNAEKLAGSLVQLCFPRLGEQTALKYSRWIIEVGQKFGVDPFLLSAVMFRQSRCRIGKPRLKGTGVGLTRIHVAAHRVHVTDGHYRYWVPEGGAWKERSLDVSQHPMTRRSLRAARANLYHAAALLSMYAAQHASLDAIVKSVSHRHHVSHFFWGDRVLGTRFEEQVLQARRRLLRLYTDAIPRPQATYRGIPIHCPLDGPPRKISSGYWATRDGGRRHRGMDFFSVQGEPVRSIADGVVFFAGIDHPRRGAHNLRPTTARRFRRRAVGKGGLFVMIDHGKGLVSGYYHLSRFTVQRGQQVKGGQLIGRVGRSGMKRSSAHLHFDLRYMGSKFNPFHHMQTYLLPPTGRHEVLVEDDSDTAKKSKRRTRKKVKKVKKVKKPAGP